MGVPHPADGCVIKPKDRKIDPYFSLFFVSIKCDISSFKERIKLKSCQVLTGEALPPVTWPKIRFVIICAHFNK